MDPALPSNWVLLAIACFCFLLCFLPPCFRCINTLWLNPRRHHLIAQKQGLRGPPPRLLLGNVMQIKALRENVPDALDSFRHDLTLQHIFPDHVLWTKVYGKRHVIWWGPDANIVTTEMDLLKEVLSSKYTITLGKPSLLQSFLEPVTGMGLVLANGETWSHERRVIGPAFHFEKVKGFAEIMMKSTEEMLDNWHRIISDANGRAEIRIDESMTKLTAGIIAHTQFGSSYKRAKKIFEDLDKLTEFVFRYGHLLIIPGMKSLPTPAFLELKRIKRTVEASIREIIQDRKDSVEAGKSASYGADLLGLMLAESETVGTKDEKQKPQQLSMQQLVDECKTFFFAGHETTAQLLTWTLLLLAANTSWQDRARAEVMNVCKNKLPDSESAARMKIVCFFTGFDG